MEQIFSFSSLSETDRGLFREWGRLFRLCSNPLPAEAAVGTVVVPTGDWMERAEAGLKFFVRKFSQQQDEPHFVITGQNSSQYLPSQKSRPTTPMLFCNRGLFTDR